jgi:hypothetical protein
VGTVEPIDGIVSGGTAMALRRSLAGLLGVPALLLPALLAGCGDDSSVADPPVQSAPPSIATSDPPAHESADHFIRRWAGVEKQMQNTGVTERYLALSKNCRACMTLAHLVSSYYADGGFIHWGGWDILSIKRYPSSTDGVSFAVHSNSSPTRYKSSANAKVQRLAGGSITYVLKLAPVDSSFLVTSKAQLAQ